MPSHRTHLKLTKSMFPHIDPNIISQVNRAMDYPTLWDTTQKRLMGDVAPVPFMRKSGHRTYNHDFISASMKGFQVGGIPGVEAAYSHLAADVLKDSFVRVMGKEAADVWENLYLWTMSNTKKR